jgi:hypothetical protein
MVKVKHSFKNLKQNPLLESLVAEAKRSVKGLQCPMHPTQDSTVRLRIASNRSMREVEACCYGFQQTVEQAIINSGRNAS